jgi:glycosyltransferase involved in cell wall biosynthesis
MNRSILFLTTFPYREPRHGGQVRMHHVESTFRSAGWRVRCIAVYDEKAYGNQQIGGHDIPFPSDARWREFNGRPVPLIDDLLAGVYAQADTGGFPLVMRRLPDQVDAIHVEHPWLWPLARKIQKTRGDSHLALIYGSANIEARLKADILASAEVTDAADVIKYTQELEQMATSEADLVLAVTQSDADVLSSYGPRRILLAPNGIEPWRASEAELTRWRPRLPQSPWLLYVASAHPPNFTGVIDTMGDTLGFLPPDSRLVVAGSVCEHIYRVFAASRWHALNLARLELLFGLADAELAAVKELAHAFVLPIAHGGGSMLKTAEAIYSGRYVIGTSAAFRGYEDFLQLPELMLADSPVAFGNAVKRALRLPPAAEMAGVRGAREALRWDRCLAELPAQVEEIVRAKHDR